MKHLTGCYRSDALGAALVLVQGKRFRDNLPIVMAGVWEPLSEDATTTARVEGKRFGELMSEWFDRQGMPICTRAAASKCIKAVGKDFAKWYEGHGRKELECLSGCGEPSWSVLVGVGEECFYAWKGGGEIHLLNVCFDRLNRRKLTWHTNEMQLEFAGLEAGVGILLGTQSFFEYLPEKDLKECLAVASMENNEQIERHLKEAVHEAVSRGAKHPAAVLTVTKEG